VLAGTVGQRIAERIQRGQADADAGGEHEVGARCEREVASGSPRAADEQQERERLGEILHGVVEAVREEEQYRGGLHQHRERRDAQGAQLLRGRESGLQHCRPQDEPREEPCSEHP